MTDRKIIRAVKRQCREDIVAFTAALKERMQEQHPIKNKGVIAECNGSITTLLEVLQTFRMLEKKARRK